MALVDHNILFQRKGLDPVGALGQGYQLKGLIRQDQQADREQAFRQAFDQAAQGQDLTTEDGLRNALRQTAQAFPQESLDVYQKWQAKMPKAAQQEYQLEKDETGTFRSINKSTGLDPQGRQVKGWQPADGLTFEQRKDLERLKAELASGKPLSPYQQAMLGFMDKRASAAEKQAEIAAKRYERMEEEQDASRATSFAKNTNDLFTEIHMWKKLDKALPGGIYGEGGVSGFGFGSKPLRKFWKTDEAKTIRPTLQTLINMILRRRSGAAVTDQEFDRLETEFGINTTGTIEEFRLGLQNNYEMTKGQWDRYYAADPRAAKMVEDRAGKIKAADPIRPPSDAIAPFADPNEEAEYQAWKKAQGL